MTAGRTTVDLIQEASAIVKLVAELSDDPEDITRRALQGALTILATAALFLEEPAPDEVAPS